MTAQQNHTVWSAHMSSVVETVAVGTCLVLDSTADYYIISTSANRTSVGRRSAGIALTAGSVAVPIVEMLTVGVVDTSISGLGAGSASAVRVSSAGILERVASPVSADDCVGRCDADGTAYLNFANPWEAIAGLAGGGGGTPGGSDTQVQRNNAGAFGAITGATSDGTNLTVLDSALRIVDNSDTTKVVQLQVSGITTGTTRALTVPDADLTIVGTATTQTLTNKSIDADTNTVTNIENADIKAAANIAVSKLAASGTNGQILETFTGVPTWKPRDFFTLASTATGTVNDAATIDGNSNPCGVLRWAGTDPVTYTSFASPTESRQIIIYNAAASAEDTVTIEDAAATGTAANRIETSTNVDIVLAPGEAALIVYDATTSRWRAYYLSFSSSNITLAGDITGTPAGTTVAQLQGVVLSGTPAAGSVLRATGAAAASWGTLDLADADARTGTLPVANGGTGITSLGAGIATWLGTPSSANLASAMTDETGSAGNVVFSTNPTLTGPTITTSVTLSGKPSVTNNGTRISTVALVGELNSHATTTPTVITGASFTMADETLVTFDFICWASRRTNVTKGGRWKGSVTYRRTSGGAPTIVGAAEYATAQETTAGDDAAFTVSSNTVSVSFTAADTDSRNVGCELVYRVATAV